MPIAVVEQSSEWTNKKRYFETNIRFVCYFHNVKSNFVRSWDLHVCIVRGTEVLICE